jgi:hypothetical protein
MGIPEREKYFAEFEAIEIVSERDAFDDFEGVEISD